MVPGFVSKSAWLYCQFTQQANLQNYHARGRGKVEDKTNHKSTLIGLAVTMLIIPNLSFFSCLHAFLLDSQGRGYMFLPSLPLETLHKTRASCAFQNIHWLLKFKPRNKKVKASLKHNFYGCLGQAPFHYFI